MAADSGSLWALKPSAQTGAGRRQHLRITPSAGRAPTAGWEAGCRPRPAQSTQETGLWAAASLRERTRKGRGRAPSFAAGLPASPPTAFPWSLLSTSPRNRRQRRAGGRARRVPARRPCSGEGTSRAHVGRSGAPGPSLALQRRRGLSWGCRQSAGLCSLPVRACSYGLGDNNS